MPSECAAVGCSEKLTKEFSFHAFRFRTKWSQKTTVANGNESMGPSHKEVGTKTPRCALLKAFRKKMLHRSPPAEHSVWAQKHVHSVTDFEKFPVRTSKDEAPTPLPVVGSLFISPLLFRLSRALLGVSVFFVVFSFHNRLDLIMEPAFYCVFCFIFPIYPCLFHHM